MFRSMSTRHVAKFANTRCAWRPNLVNSCLVKSFSSDIRRHQKETDVDGDLENGRKWSTPLAKQLFAAISVSERAPGALRYHVC